MARRELLAVGALIGSIAGVVVFDRMQRNRQRVDLYYEDGSMVSIPGSMREAGTLVAPAREALRATQ